MTNCHLCLKRVNADIEMVILIDIDDTIEYLCRTWCKWLNLKYGTNVKYRNITNWDLSVFFPSLSRDQVYEPLHNANFWKIVPPMLDAIKYIKMLINEGNKVYLCTSTDYRNIRPKFEYVIQKYFPYISWNQVIVAANKQMIRGDILVDDAPHNLENGKYYKILMSAPHNKNYNAEKNGMIRVNSWREIYNTIHLIKQKRGKRYESNKTKRNKG